MSSPQPRLNSSAGHRLFTVTPDDHRGQVWTVAVIFGIFALFVLCIRGFIRRGNLGQDDSSAAAATVKQHMPDIISVLDLVQLGCILAAASKGLGQIDGGPRMAKVGSVSFAWAFILSGIGRAESSYPLQLTMASEAILLLGLALAKCSVLFLLLRWEVITAVDSIIEIGIFIQAVALVRPLQMKFQRKVSIALVFSLRLPLAILSTFLKKFNSGMGLSLTSKRYATGTHRGEYELSSLKKRSIPETSDTEHLRLTTGNEKNISNVSHSNPEFKSPSLGEASQRMGIRRDFHVHVSYENVRDPTYQAEISRL
ncbi:MAG: hypothetical protein Q9179_005502 [Wetmoreana sp. 5 TL-2023]